MNEVLLIAQLVVFYTMVIVAYKLFGKTGLMCWTVLATIAANIEVLIAIEAYGMDMTLGNILFATTFVVTDILSEVAGKKYATKAVNIGIATSITFIIVSQSWLLFTPSVEDFVMPSIKTIFSNTPRLMLVSLTVYAIVQRLDVFLYHKWWDFTSKKFGDSRKYLWLRNNGSTLISQMMNSVLFTFGAFYGVFSTSALIGMISSGFIIFLVTSVADTPVVYICRRIHEKRV